MRAVLVELFSIIPLIPHHLRFSTLLSKTKKLPRSNILMITGGVYFVNNLSKNAEKTAEILEKYNISAEEDEEEEY